jgi:hypothetical protein
MIAVIHVAIVASLGAKLLVDRATRPRVWARTAPIDPNLPIRGRYVRLRLEAAASGELRPNARGMNVAPAVAWQMGAPVALSVQDGRLIAAPATSSSTLTARVTDRNGERVAVLDEPIAYFIPEHVADPSRRPSGEELWVEVTLPRAGAPRPIQLGVKRNGVLTPLRID